MSDSETWATNHQPKIMLDNEARPGPPDANGVRWTERRLTGFGIAACSCGYTTGRVPRDQLPEIMKFVGEHPPYGRPDLMGGGTE